jgi:hypothetical protein
MEQGYYRLVEHIDDPDDESLSEMEVGSLWYLSDIVGDEVTLIQGESTWTLPLGVFTSSFDLAPDGVEERQGELNALLNDLHNIGDRQDNLIESATTPKLLNDETQPVKQSSATEFASVVSRANPVVAAKNLKKVKTAFAVTKNQIAKRQAALASLIKEQQLILHAKSAALTKQIELAQEAIYIINAYLGQDEEIIRIQRGEPAPQDEKIVVRQQVLYMDEESAVASDNAKCGGIDFENIESFDKWICDPAHLQQVLPERRGIVALKPRRNPKHYDDNPFVNSELNRRNKCLYILIRNGDNLYRVFTTLWVEDVFLPRKDEFEHFFYESRTDWRTHETIREPLTPGSSKYMQAMDKAESKKRRFYAALILIQGIVDRTKVFHPLPDEPINVCAIEGQQHVILRYDAENLLGTGRPGFDKWLDSVNGALEVGCRIAGEFDSYHFHYQELGKRQGNKYALRPNSYQLHVLEKKVPNEGFKFYYENDRGWGERSRIRVSYTVYKRDDFIINIDNVTISDINYYLYSRTNRHNYIHMVPLLKAALKIKQKELEEEAPFRQLLIGEIAKAHNTSIASAERSIDALIHWWKFKVREHRALTSDDAKALRMIVSEYGRRRTLYDDNLADAHNHAAEKLGDEKTLAIFYRPDRSYTVLRFENDENIYVREEVWRLYADASLSSVLATTDGQNIIHFDCGVFVRLISSKDWTVVDIRHQSWQLVCAHNRWNEWNIGARPQEHLTDAERKQAAEFILAKLEMERTKKPDADKSIFLDWRHKKGYRKWLQPLAVVSDSKERIYLYYLLYHGAASKWFMTGDTHSPEYARISIIWKKKGDEFKFRIAGYSGVCIDMKNPPWVTYKAIVTFENNIAAAITEEDRAKAVEKKQRRYSRPIHAIEQAITNAKKVAWYEEQHVKFLDDYVDEDDVLWEGYKEDLKVPDLWPRWIDNAAGYLIERNINFDGLTIEQFLVEAKKCGYDGTAEDDDYFEAIKSITIRYQPVSEDEDEDDDDW